MFDFIPSFQTVCQLLVNGILSGTMYGIAAIGLSIIFGTMRIMFFAQGSMIILAAYCCFWLFKLFSIDPYLSIVIIVPGTTLFGLGLYQGLFRRVARSEGTSLLIAFGLLVLLENLMSVVWSPDPRSIKTVYTAYGIPFAGLRLSFTRLMAFIMALLSTLGVTFFMKKTLMGKAVRAASENLDYATLVGIMPHWVNGIAFALGIGLAGMAGIATATTYAITPYFGFAFTMKAFIAMALGAISSVPGALLGGVLIGLIESIGAYFISSGWADAIAFAIFLLVIMFRPEGLFGRSSKVARNVAISLPVNSGEVRTVIGFSDWKLKTHIAPPVLIVFLLSVFPFLLNVETSYTAYFLFLVFIYIALTQSWNLIAGYTGQISIGHHAFFGIGAYLTGFIWLHDVTGTGYYFDPLTMFLTGLGSAVLAIIIGIPLLSRLRGDYFALGTLGLGEILRAAFTRGGTLTGGSMGLFLPSNVYTSFKPHYLTALLLAAFATGLTYFIVKSRTGLALVAVKEDEIAAAAKGINILKYKVLAFALSAFIAGLCGSLYAYYIFNVTPSNCFSLNWSLYPIIMCILGGVGTIVGPIIGALCLTGLFELTKMWLPMGHPILSGLLIIVLVLFLPNGLARLEFGKWVTTLASGRKM
jgi:branched-subunit amino acid ABC-type transport system permease component